MNVRLDHSKVMKRVDEYFNLLSHTGYVKSPALDNLLLYLFVYDFESELWLFLDAKDLHIIDSVVEPVFGKGCCLFPYDTNMSTSMNAGGVGYMGIPEFRAEEDDRSIRSSEDGVIREDEI